MSYNSEIARKKSIVMVILAAGKSSRMKTVKQLLKWKNTTLLANAIEIGLKSNVNSVMVVLGANSELIRPSINHFNIDIVENENWEHGLGSSISCSIQHIKESDAEVNGVLLCLADMPFVEVSHLNKMIENYKSNNSLMIATKLKNKVMVPALFDSIYFNELISLKGDVGANKLLKKHHDILTLIEASLENTLVDMDTLEDYNCYKED